MKIIVTMSVILLNVLDEFTMIRVYIEKKMINETNLDRSEFDDKTKNILINLFVIVNIVSQFHLNHLISCSFLLFRVENEPSVVIF